jgi:hypothetical protein
MPALTFKINTTPLYITVANKKERLGHQSARTIQLPLSLTAGLIAPPSNYLGTRYPDSRVHKPPIGILVDA